MSISVVSPQAGHFGSVFEDITDRKLREEELRQMNEDETVLFGDRRGLVEIWQNLIDNAVKYAGDQLAPCVEIGVEERAGETIFFVRDNGIEPRSRRRFSGCSKSSMRQAKARGSGWRSFGGL